MAPPRKDTAAAASGSSTANGPVVAAAVPLTREALEEMENKRDAFVEAMNTLSYAAKTAARTGFEYFNILAASSGITPPTSLLPFEASSALASSLPISNGFVPINYNAHVRAQSVAPAESRGRAAPATASQPLVEEEAEDGIDESGKKKRKRGTKREKKETDPDAPKKPISAYFQFTAAARPIIKKDMGEGISAKEIITEAANRWQALPGNEKKIWLAQHHRQMVQWYTDVNAYRASKGLPLEPVPDQYHPGAKPPTHPDDDSAHPPVIEEEEETATATPEEDDDDEEEESPATPPPRPAKKARATPKSAQANGNGAPQQPPKKRGRPPANPAAASTTPAKKPTPAEATPDTTKRRRAPSIKAKEAKEAAVKEKERSRAAAAAAATPTTKAGAGVDGPTNTDPAEKQVLQEEAEGSITVAGAKPVGVEKAVGETPGGSGEKKKERKKRKGKGEE